MVSLLVKEFPAMYVTRCFITMWTKKKTATDPFSVTLRQSAKPKIMSISGTRFPIRIFTVSSEPLAQI